MAPNVISGQAIGTIINVIDSTALAQLSIQGIAVGTPVFNESVGSNFVLTISNAALSPDSVVQVKDIDGLRWIKAAAGGGAVDTVGGAGPIKSTGGINPIISKDPWFNSAVQYVSPAGNDSHDGLGWDTAKKTGWAAFEYLQTNHGGIMHMAQDCSWVDNANLLLGQVANQGAWFYGPGSDSGKGFQRAVWPVVIIGDGPGSSQSQPTPFQRPGTVMFYGGSNLPEDFRRKPGIWKVGCLQGPTFYNLQVAPYIGAENGELSSYYSIRDGWNYNRLGDTPQSIMYQTVSSSTRAAGFTTHTVTLSPSATVERATRTSGVTTLAMHNTTSGIGCSAPPWSIGTKIWFQSTTGDFASGAYTVTNVNATALGIGDWTLTYSDPGPDKTDVSPGAVTSVIASIGDLIDLESTSAQFPSTTYLVTDTAVTGINSGTITVKDIYAGVGVIVDGTVANVGHLAHQERNYFCSVASRYYNVNDRAPSSPTTSTPLDSYFRWGPGVDIAASTAFPQEIHDSFICGYKPSVASTLPYDDLRMCSLLLKGGSVTTPGLYVRNCTGAMATLRGVFSTPFGTGGQGLFDVDGWLTDSGSHNETPGAYDIDGSNATDVSIYNVIVADYNIGFGPALNRIVGINGLKLRGDASAIGPWPSVAPQMGTTDGFGILGLDKTPWTHGQPATWTYDLQTSGKHPSAWRQVSPVSRRFIEQARAPADYTTSAPPTSTTPTDPTGGSGAYSYDSTAGAIYVFSFDHTFTFSPGDRIAVCGWVNANSLDGFGGAGSPLISVISLSGDVIWNSTGTASWQKAPPVKEPGWQFFTFFDSVVSSSGASNLQVKFSGPIGGGTLDVFGVSVYYFPVSMSETDIAEFCGTVRAVPHYMPVGMAGTFEGQKLIGHGGLGTAARYVVGGSSGQIALTGVNGKAVELFDEAGTSLGVAVLQGFTVNP